MWRRLSDWIGRLTLIEMMVVAAILAVIAAVVFGPGRDEDCRELCGMLNKKPVGTVRSTCVCEDPRTGERDAYSDRFGR